MKGMRCAYPITEILVPSSFATSGIAGMNEPKTKTMSHTGKKNRASMVGQRHMDTPERKVTRRTGDESSPCDEGDDGVFAARRKPEVDEIVVGFRSLLRSQKRRLF